MSDHEVIRRLERQNELLEAILREIRNEDLPDSNADLTFSAEPERTEARVMCPSCGYVIQPNSDKCPGCGWEKE